MAETVEDGGQDGLLVLGPAAHKPDAEAVAAPAPPGRGRPGRRDRRGLLRALITSAPRTCPARSLTHSPGSGGWTTSSETTLDDHQAELARPNGEGRRLGNGEGKGS